MSEHKPMVQARITSLAVELMNTLRDPAKDVFVEGAEIILDMSLDEGVLKDIPIVGHIVGITRSFMSIPDRLFILKLRRFVSQLDGVPEEKRNTFLDKMERDGLFEKVGEKVLMIVDQLDDTEKASLAGLVFRAYVTGTIDKDQFETLCSCIRLTRIADLHEFLRNFKQMNVLDPHVGRALSLAGLADWDINIGETSLASESVHGSIFYKASSYGILLAHILNQRD